MSFSKSLLIEACKLATVMRKCSNDRAQVRKTVQKKREKKEKKQNVMRKFSNDRAEVPKTRQKMTGGTPEVRSDKSLTLMTFYFRHSTNGPMDQRTNGPMDQWTNGPMDQWTNGPIVQWTNGPMDQ